MTPTKLTAGYDLISRPKYAQVMAGLVLSDPVVSLEKVAARQVFIWIKWPPIGNIEGTCSSRKTYSKMKFFESRIKSTYTAIQRKHTHFLLCQT